jgi:hypothetical protein
MRQCGQAGAELPASDRFSEVAAAGVNGCIPFMSADDVDTANWLRSLDEVEKLAAPIGPNTRIYRRSIPTIAAMRIGFFWRWIDLSLNKLHRANFIEERVPDAILIADSQASYGKTRASRIKLSAPITHAKVTARTK